MKSKRVAVVGAGFSGLSTAFFLAEAGHQVTVFEGKPEIGGLIQTLKTPAGLVETAANGFLNTALWEQVFQTLDIPMVFPSSASRARYIYRGKLRQWPLTFKESLLFFWKLISCALFSKTKFKPRAGESIRQWGHRCLGVDATNYFLEPGLGGIYAGDPEKLSATLVLRSISGKKKKAKVRGLASAPEGMGQVLLAMRTYVENHFGRIVTTRSIQNLNDLKQSHDEVILCCGPHSTAELLRTENPGTSEVLKDVVGLPLASVALGFSKNSQQPRGFGVLFPRDQGIRSLGVLFSDCIFSDRSEERLETWILGGGTDPEVPSLSDTLILEQVLADRARALGLKEHPQFVRIQKWEHSIPHYNLDLEGALRSNLELSPHIHLVGNYLGGIGLSKILERAKFVAETISASQ